MRTIADIRLYRSETVNEYGAPSLEDFAGHALTASVHRIAMKLREQGFSLGEFDHLYLIFTPDQPEGTISLSDTVDRYHPWYRLCYVHTSEEDYARLHEAEACEYVINALGRVLTSLFSNNSFSEKQILACIQHALEHGEQMQVRFKEKQTATRKAEVFLRYLDACRYWPLLCVHDAEGALLLEQDLPETLMLDAYGEILLSRKKVTIKPRRNAFTENMSPMVFEY